MVEWWRPPRLGIVVVTLCVVGVVCRLRECGREIGVVVVGECGSFPEESECGDPRRGCCYPPPCPPPQSDDVCWGGFVPESICLGTALLGGRGYG